MVNILSSTRAAREAKGCRLGVNQNPRQAPLADDTSTFDIQPLLAVSC